MDVFDLAATLSLDTSQYESGLAGASESAQGFGGTAAKVAAGVSKGFKAAAVAGGVIAAAGTAITGAFVGAAKKTADYGDKVDKMSQKIGISAESYQKWDYVMQRAGGNVDSLKMGMKTLSQQAQKNNESFQKLGISQEEVANLSQEDLFEKTVKGLASMEQGTERATIASELLGRAGADMGPLLNQGSGAIEEQMEIAEKYGMIMPDSAVKASAAFEDSLTTMQMTFQGLKNRMMAEFLPAMTEVTDGMAKLFAGDMSGADDVAEGIEGILKKVGEILPVLMDIGGRIIANLAKGFVDNLPSMLSTIGSGLANIGKKILEWVAKVPELMGSADIAGGFDTAVQKLFTDVLPNMATKIADFISGMADWLVDNGPSLIISLAKGIITAIPHVISAMGTVVNAILRVVIGLPVRLLSMGLVAIGKYAAGILKGVGKVVSSMGRVVGGIVGAVASLPAKLLSAAGRAVRSLASGISKGASGAMKAAKNMIGKVFSTVKGKLGDFLDIGKNIVGGIQKGIGGAWDAFKRWLGKKLKGLPKPVRKFLGISSPSKVFAREVGQWIPKGIAKGIEDNEDAIEDALDDVMDDAMPDVGDYMFNTAGGGHGITNKYMTFNYNTTVDGATDPEAWGEASMRAVKREMRSE